MRDRFEEQITRIARSTAEAMRGTADVEYLRIVPVTVNDLGMIDVVTGAAGKIFGDKGVIEADLQMGGEDFAFYQEKVPGAMVLLGVRNEACDAVWPQHHGCYKVDESVLVKAPRFTFRPRSTSSASTCNNARLTSLFLHSPAGTSPRGTVCIFSIMPSGASAAPVPQSRQP